MKKYQWASIMCMLCMICYYVSDKAVAPLILGFVFAAAFIFFPNEL